MVCIWLIWNHTMLGNCFFFFLQMSSLEIQLISLKETNESNIKRVEDLSNKLKQVMSLWSLSKDSDFLICILYVS